MTLTSMQKLGGYLAALWTSVAVVIIAAYAGMLGYEAGWWAVGAVILVAIIVIVLIANDGVSWE